MGTNISNTAMFATRSNLFQVSIDTPINYIVYGYVREKYQNHEMIPIEIIQLFFDYLDDNTIKIKYQVTPLWFKLFDKDGDGVTTHGEIVEIMHNLRILKVNHGSYSELRKLVRRWISVGHNRTIDIDEFVSLVREKRAGGQRNSEEKTIIGVASPKQELQQAFEIFDNNKLDFITIDKLCKLMNHLDEKELKNEHIQFLLRCIGIYEDDFIDSNIFCEMLSLASIKYEHMEKMMRHEANAKIQ